MPSNTTIPLELTREQAETILTALGMMQRNDEMTLKDLPNKGVSDGVLTRMSDWIEELKGLRSLVKQRIQDHDLSVVTRG